MKNNKYKSQLRNLILELATDKLDIGDSLRAYEKDARFWDAPEYKYGEPVKPTKRDIEKYAKWSDEWFIFHNNYWLVALNNGDEDEWKQFAEGMDDDDDVLRIINTIGFEEAVALYHSIDWDKEDDKLRKRYDIPAKTNKRHWNKFKKLAAASTTCTTATK